MSRYAVFGYAGICRVLVNQLLKPLGAVYDNLLQVLDVVLRYSLVYCVLYACIAYVMTVCIVRLLCVYCLYCFLILVVFIVCIVFAGP